MNGRMSKKIRKLAIKRANKYAKQGPMIVASARNAHIKGLKYQWKYHHLDCLEALIARS